MSVNVKYKDTSIAELTESGTKTLKTAGKYCEADIVVENTKDAGGKINTAWVSMDVQDLVIGANNVSNPITVVSYFESIVGEGNVAGVFLKTAKSTFIKNEVVIMAQRFISTGSNALSSVCKRYRDGAIKDFGLTAGYDCSLLEGETYQIIYYTNKP